MNAPEQPLQRPFFLRRSVHRSVGVRIFAYAVTPILVLIIETIRSSGGAPAAPFLILFLGMVMSGSLGGLRVALINAFAGCAYIIYSMVIGFGPPALTGSVLNALLGCFVCSASAVVLGSSRDQILSLFRQLETREVDILRSNQELEQRVANRTRELRHVSNTMLTAVEQERRHIAGELHDQLGQTATALKLSLHMLQSKVQDPDTSERFHRCVTMVDSIIRHIRNMALMLRPPMLDTLGLEDTLRWYVEDQKNLGLPIQAEIEHLDERPNSTTETSCFRIAQECLTNITRHANAENIRVRLSVENDVLDLTVEDDGHGFDLAEVESHASQGISFGVAGMAERARLAGGQLTISSSPKDGTCVKASFARWRDAEIVSLEY